MGTYLEALRLILGGLR